MTVSQMLPGELAAQISRVTKLRDQYREAQKLCGPQGNMRPAIAMMTTSLSQAIAAAGSPDTEGQIPGRAGSAGILEMTPAEARAYVALFRKYTMPGTFRAYAGERVIHLDDMTDDDAVFVAREFQRIEAAAAQGVRRQ